VILPDSPIPDSPIEKVANLTLFNNFVWQYHFKFDENKF